MAFDRATSMRPPVVTLHGVGVVVPKEDPILSRFMDRANAAIRLAVDSDAAFNAVFAPGGLAFTELDESQRESFRKSPRWNELMDALARVGVDE